VVRLSDEVQSFVGEQVASRQLESASEFISSLVEEARRRTTIEQVDKLLVEGLSSGLGEEATAEWWAKVRSAEAQST
jgi:Arc/MetJ-type ribon-helix-helix transcriptional regulator